MMGFGPCFSIASAAVLALATVASAECPVPGDLAQGIAMRDDGGGVTIFRKGGAPGEVTETTLFDDNTGFFIRSSGGLLVTQAYDLENGEKVDGSEVITQLEAAETVFPVAEGRRLELSGSESGAVGTEIGLTVVIETSLRRRVLYGDCAVEAIPVRVTYDHENRPAEVEYLDYLTEFGISLFLGAGERGSAPDIYRVVELFKAPPE